MTDNCGFPKSIRLRKPAEFNTVYQNNQIRVRGQYFMVLAFSRFETDENSIDNLNIDDKIPAATRAGMVVSKKVSKLAVRRNRIKRLMREYFRTHDFARGFDLVLIAKPQANRANNQQLCKELDYLWRKLKKQCVTS